MILQSFADEQCSGKLSCEIMGSVPVHRNIRPCPVELMSYLIAGYQCVEGNFIHGKYDVFDIFCIFFYNLQSFADTQCSARRTCEIMGSVLVHRNIRPCPVELMSYLIAGYDCIEGKLEKETQEI